MFLNSEWWENYLINEIEIIIKMESIYPSRKILATKISYISNIMTYYGYVHEWAELYRQLCKDSRTEWDKNSHINFTV